MKARADGSWTADGMGNEIVPQAFNWQSGGDARGLDLTDQPSALTTQQTPAVLMTMREGKPGGGKGPLMVEEESLTLATGNGQTLFQPDGAVESLTPWPEIGEAMRVYGDAGASPSLKQHSPNVLQTYGVRRLTPVECERLQAFPDGWTEPAGSDSARYKAMGNAVTVNTVRWILGRMLEQS